MVKFIENHKWVEFDTIKQVYKLFEPDQDPAMLMPISPRVDDITMEDGTVITSDIALKKLREIAIQEHLDSEAQAVGYDSIMSACSYAGAVNDFQAEGISFLNWRSAVWTAAYQILADVENNVRPLPTIAEIIAELPTRVV